MSAVTHALRDLLGDRSPDGEVDADVGDSTADVDSEGETGASDGSDDRVVAMVGCPNVGKSVLFNALAGGSAEVSNYPGTTLEAAVGSLDDATLIDTPGVYGVSSFDEEERVTRETVLEADAVLNVVSATSLDRDLFLTLQLLDMGVPTVVAVNMMDEAETGGTTVDVDALERQLGVPVVPTVATEERGVDSLRDRLDEVDAPDETPVATWFDRLPDGLEASRAERVLLVEGDEPTVDRVVGPRDVTADGGARGLTGDAFRDEIYTHRRSRVAGVVEAVTDEREGAGGLKETLDDLLLNPVTGTPFALVLLGLVYLVIGDLVAQRLVDFVETTVFEGYYVPLVRGLVAGALPDAGWAAPVRFLLINGNLGLLTITVQYLLGVLLPLVVAFYLVLGVLEDSGVLPRLAVLSDRGLSMLGLNGRAIIPMIVGVGCVTMAVVTTRTMGSRRERLIATALLGLAVPCSAQLGVVMGLLAGLGLGWWLAYVAILLLVFGVLGVVLDNVLPGESQGLLTELPPLRRPRVGDVVRKTARRTRAFLAEATPLFAGTAIVVSGLDYVGGLAVLESWLRPVTALLGLPADFGRVLVIGVVRRDFAAAGLTDLGLSAPQTFVGLVVVTLFVPCILSMVMILKERNLASGALIWLGSVVVALSVGAVLAGVFGL